MGIGLSIMATPSIRAETLAETLLYAYQNSPRLKASNAERKSQAELVTQARAAFFPSIEGNAQYARSSIDSQGFFLEDENRKPRSGEILVTQNVFDGFANIAQFRQARYLRSAAEQAYEEQTQQLLLDAANAFFHLIRDKNILTISRKSESFFIKQLESTKDRFAVGEVTFTDVAQAEARLAQAKAETTRSEGNYQITKAQYAEIIGKPAPENPQDPKFTFKLPKTLQEALTDAQKHHPQLKRSLLEHNAAEQAVSRAIGQLMPSVSVEGRAQRGLDTIRKGSRNESLQVTARLNVPIWRGGQAFGRLEEIKQNAHQKKHLAVQTRRTIDQNMTIAWQNLETTQAEITSYKAQVKANTIALEGVREEASVGDRTILDILDAENELFQSQTRLVRAQKDYRTAVFQILRNIGKLNLDTLALSQP